MDENAKTASIFSRDRLKFMVGWVLTWFICVLLASIIMGTGSRVFTFLDYVIWSVIGNGIGFALLAFLQVRLVKRYMEINLEHWMSLAVTGFFVGQIALRMLQTNVDYVFPPILPGSDSPELPTNIAWLRYILYSSVTTLLAWYSPLLFQWFALRKRFPRHGIWLLAILFCAPLGFLLPNSFYDGFFENAFELLTGVSNHPLEWIVIVLDWLTPPTLMGLVLLYIVQGRKAIKRSSA